MLLQTQENINHSTIVGYNGISHLSCNVDHFFSETEYRKGRLHHEISNYFPFDLKLGI